MELRWLEAHITNISTRNAGSKRYPNLVEDRNEEVRVTLQYRNSDKEEWRDVETEMEFWEQTE